MIFESRSFEQEEFSVLSALNRFFYYFIMLLLKILIGLPQDGCLVLNVVALVVEHENTIVSIQQYLTLLTGCEEHFSRFAHSCLSN